jgi:hypothetical protein
MRFPNANFARKRYVTSIHIGSDGPAKGRAIGLSRDFAAVMAQRPEQAARNRYFARIFNQLDLIPSDRMIRREGTP